MPPKPLGFRQAVYSRFHIVLMVCAAGVTAAWWVSGEIEPVYRSQARFFMPAEFDGFSLRSEQPNFPTGPKLPTSSTEQQDSILGILRSAAFRITVSDSLKDKQNTEHINSEVLRNNVDVDVDKFNMVVVTAYDHHAQTAANIAGAYVTELQGMLRLKTESDVGAKFELLLSRADLEEKELAIKENERLAFLLANDSLGGDNESQGVADRVDLHRQQVASLTAEQIRNAAQLERVITERDSRPEFVETSFVEENNPRINELKSALVSAQSKLQAVLATVTEKHPDAISAAQTVALIESDLADEDDKREKSRTWELDRLREGYLKQVTELELDSVRIQTELDSSVRLMEEALQEWRSLPPFQAALSILDRTITQMRENLGKLRDRKAEFELFQSRFRPDSDKPHNYLEVTETATAATSPWFPNLRVNLLVALFLSLILGSMLALLNTRLAEWREQAPW